MSVVKKCGFPGCEVEVTRWDSAGAIHQNFYCSPEHRFAGVGLAQRSGETRTCVREGCDVSFYAEASDPKVYCSSKCFGAVYSASRRVEFTCAFPGCGATTWRYKSAMPKTGVAYCEEHRTARGPGASRKPRRGTTHVCALDGCGVEFYLRPSSTQQYHSKECRDADKKKSVERTCSQCGKVYRRFLSQIADGDSGCCGQVCFKAAKRAAAIGSKKKTSDGYVVVFLPDHPQAQPSTGYVMEHRLVMEEIIGRPLLSGEEVHHKNGIRNDNRPTNLEFWEFSQPAGQRVEDKVAWARQMLEQYGDVAEAVDKFRDA